MIYTFYSFKGGVGRSMAVANLAESFHDKGLRVLVIDWDLEAPGLETYFAPYNANREGNLRTSRTQPGLIDLLLEYRNAYPRISARLAPVTVSAGVDAETLRASLEQASAAAEQTLLEADDFPAYLRKNPFAEMMPESPGDLPKNLEDLLVKLYEATPSPARSGPLPDTLETSPIRNYIQVIHPPDRDSKNGVYLLSAGAREGDRFATYAMSVQGFDWANFYAAFDGHQYFSWLRQKLDEIADVVLIDSRTGVTEMGGVCTRHLADVVVAFCAPNSQNVDGVLRVVTGVNRSDVKVARDDRHVDVIIVPSRVDLSESDRLTEFSEGFAKAAERPEFVPAQLQDLERPFLNLQVPYIPRYNYREERVIGPDAAPAGEVGKKLIEAYSRIAVHLAVLGRPGSRVRESYAGEIGTMFPHLVHSVPLMAPPVPDTLVHRTEESDKLTSLLLQSAGTPRVSRIGIWGPPGSGKTSLVASVCRDPKITAAFPGGILWLTPDRQWTREAAQAWLRTSFGFGRSVGTRALHNLLNARKFLLVADDVWEIESIKEVLEYGSDATHIVISRDLNVAALFGANVVSVGPLLPAETRALLGAHTRLALPDDPTHELAQRMLEWPLGASLVRAALERRLALRDSPDAAWESLRQAFLRHRVLAFDTPGTDRATSAGRSLALTLSRVEPIHRELLISLAQRPASEGLDLRVRDNMTLGAQNVRLGVEQLRDLGLATIDTDHERALVDPLVQAYLLAQGELRDSLAPRRASRTVSSSEDQKDGRNSDVERAKAMMRGESGTLEDTQALAERLKDSRYFGYARRLFAICREHPDAPKLPAARRLKLVQRHALCTYRDPDLPADRFAQAYRMLEASDLNDPAASQETLGLAGAIYKYQWRLSGLRADLERSLGFYRRGYLQGVSKDFGYTGINAAFVLDLLAAQDAQNPDDEARRRAEAQRIREEIATTLPELALQKDLAFLRTEWWFFATVAEAFFGLGRHDDARYWLREGLSLETADWQLESTTRQLAALACVQDPNLSEDSEAWRTLRVLVGDAGPALRAMMYGKVGLALSGGGFRASLFHIGVLARLAELDVLRHVEVLSCVSGGSIVGAHYYLEVRKLLSQAADREITRDDYLGVVQRIEREFLAGVQTNLRTRLFVNWWANVRTLLDPSFTRTTLLGHLFERHLYSRVQDGDTGPRFLNDLHIRPKDAEADFNPKLDNWRRAAKAPILLLNATTLNTGHNWQFAVSWMGEPPLGASTSIDRNDIMRRMYYWEAPRAHQRVRLGQAVAASACVPALFDPVELRHLFPGHTVRLVDGGVHDNQGVAGLLEQECTVVLVSDASGQTNTQAQPSGELTGVSLRANGILMARVREAEYRELEVLRRAGALGGLMFLHLKKDLAARHLDWVDSSDPYAPVRDTHVDRMLPRTSYGVERRVQEALAGLRTDLDSFSDKEAYALMVSGYRMADHEFTDALPRWPASRGERPPWAFSVMDAAVTRQDAAADDTTDLVTRLRVGASRGFKIWRQASPALAIPIALAVLLVIVLDSLFNPRVGDATRAMSALGWFIGWIAVAGFTVLFLHRTNNSPKSLTVIATGLAMITVGWLAAAVHLLFFDPLFLLNGSVDRGKARRTAMKRCSAGTAIVVLALVAGMGATRWRSSSGPPETTQAVPPATSPQAAAAKARALQAEQAYAAAIPLWTEVLGSNGNDRDALAARAYAEMEVGDLDAAVNDYTAALKIQQTPELLRARAYARRQTDRLEEARSDLEAALRIEPTHDQTVQDLRYIDYLLRPRGTDNRIPARVYVQVANPLQTVGIDTIRNALGASVLVRPATVVARVPDVTELRYTQAEDGKEAERIAGQLGAVGVRAAVKQVPGGGRPRHFELWLSSDARWRR